MHHAGRELGSASNAPRARHRRVCPAGSRTEQRRPPAILVGTLSAVDTNCTIWGMSELSISAARDHLGEIVSRAEHGHERIVLTRHGKAVAAVISIDDLRELEAVEDEADLAAVREALASDESRIPHVEVLAEYGIA